MQSHNEELDDKVNFHKFSNLNYNQMNYESFCELRNEVKQKFPKKNCQNYFSPNVFLRFQRDSRGRIGIEPLHNYIIKKVQYELLLIKLSNYDTVGDDHLREQVSN